MAKEIIGKCGALSPESVSKLVHEFVETALKTRDKSISVNFMEDSTYVSVSPYYGFREVITIDWLVQKQEELSRMDGDEALNTAKEITNILAMWNRENATRD